MKSSPGQRPDLAQQIRVFDFPVLGRQQDLAQDHGPVRAFFVLPPLRPEFAARAQEFLQGFIAFEQFRFGAAP